MTTTNVLLGILVTFSILEALFFVAVLAGTFMLFKRVVGLLKEFDERRVAPVSAKVVEILDNVQDVTSFVKWLRNRRWA